MSRKKNKTRKLSSKMAVIISGLLAAVFIILIAVTVYFTQTAINATVSNELSAISQANGLEVKQIIEASTNVGETVDFYLSNLYQNAGEQTAVQNGSGAYESRYSIHRS